MKIFVHETTFTKIFIALAGVFFLALSIPGNGLAQKEPAARPGFQAAGEKSPADQIRALQEKVERLEAVLGQSPAPSPGGASGMGKMAMGPGSQRGSMQGMGPMQGMDMMGSRMGSMPGMVPAQSGRGASGMGMTGGMGMGGMSGGGGMGMMDMMGGMGMGSMQPGKAMGPMESMMGMMGRNPAGGGMAMGAMSLPSTLPGFPGASHLYHIGATDFFLDHPQHITLTVEQQTTLNRTKEQALLAQAQSQRKIDQTEEELWSLTSADQPDAAKIEAKVREIEKLNGDQRLSFIRSVDEATKVLTSEQIKSLTGQVPPAGHSGGATHQQQP